MQWVNHRSFASYLYYDDCGEEQEFHPLYETPATIAPAFFQECPKLVKFRVLHCYGTHKYGCTRDKNGAADKIEFQADKGQWYGFKSAFQTYWPMPWW